VKQHGVIFAKAQKCIVVLQLSCSCEPPPTAATCPPPVCLCWGRF